MRLRRSAFVAAWMLLLLAALLMAAWTAWPRRHHRPAPSTPALPPTARHARDAPPSEGPLAQSTSLLSLPPLGQAWAPGGTAAWEQRLSDAHSERLRLQGAAGLSAARREEAMQAYLAANFSPAERAQAEALLRLMPN